MKEITGSSIELVQDDISAATAKAAITKEVKKVFPVVSSGDGVEAVVCKQKDGIGTIFNFDVHRTPVVAEQTGLVSVCLPASSVGEGASTSGKIVGSRIASIEKHEEKNVPVNPALLAGVSMYLSAEKNCSSFVSDKEIWSEDGF